MDDYQIKYEKLKNEYENYQSFAELQIQKLSHINVKLEKDLDVLVNIVQINKYINSFLNDENLISMINDMILGLMGVVYSTICIEDNGEFIVKATNANFSKIVLTDEEKKYMDNGKSFLINSQNPIREYLDSNIQVRSVIGMPIKIRDEYIGFILVEHQIYNFLNKDHEKFLETISNQIVIAIENSMLYLESQEIAKRDSLLNIYNRRNFFDLASKKILENPNKKYAIVMVDLDNFKKVNDNYGHQFGDKVLIKSTEIIKNMLDPEDIIARYGGEEIIIYINEAESIKEVYEKIEAIRVEIEKTVITNENISKTITASFGIGCYPNDGKNIDEVIRIADKYLYKSKSLGKNMVLASELVT